MNPNLRDYIKHHCPIHIQDLCKMFGKNESYIIELIQPLLKQERFSFEEGVLKYE